MRQRLAVLTAVLTLAGVAACSDDDKPTPPAQSSAPGGVLPSATIDEPKPTAPGGSATASLPPGHDLGLPASSELTAAGLLPYVIGAAQAELASDGEIGQVATGGNGCDTAQGVSDYGSPALVFTKGKLVHLKVTSPTTSTAKGVAVGSPLADVQARYPEGKALSGPAGATAWYATSGDGALLFRITDGKVAAIEAGPSATLEVTFTANRDC